ncbi:MAG: hypothetical protein U0Q22_03270 [Acidimicrobiales bacterium]
MAELEQRRARANELIALHSPLAHRLTNERTSYQSQLIPVTPYILVACAETFARYAEMMRTIDAAMPAEEIGRLGRRPGSQVNTVFLWSIANFYLVGRKVFCGFDPATDVAPGRVDDTFTVMDFWERAARGFRGDGTLTAAEGGGAIRVYDDAILDRLIAGAVEVDDDVRALVKRFNATLINYLFLLYFDTRVGSGDTGPYDLGDGRTLVVRDYHKLGRSDFPWSDAAADVPYQHLLAGFVLSGVDVTITDFGTSNTTPENYLDHLVGFSLFTTDGCAPGELRPVPLDSLDDLMRTVRRAEATHYRNIAAMSRDEMIANGAYVYFSFLRPFAEVAGIADDLDWSVPRAVEPHVYELLIAIGTELGSAPMPDEHPDEYYLPIPPLA